MARHLVIGTLLILPSMAEAGAILMERGPYKGLMESVDCKPPVTLRVMGDSAADFGYLNKAFQEGVRQIATLAWLRCPQLREFQVKALIPPANDPVMAFPVRISDQWSIAPQPIEPDAHQPTPRPERALTPPEGAENWSGRSVPPPDQTLAEAVGKPISEVRGLSRQAKIGLMEILAAKAGSLDAWQKISKQAHAGSQAAKIGLANLLLGNRGSAPMNSQQFLINVVGVSEEIALQGEVAAAQFFMRAGSESSSEEPADKHDGTGLIPGMGRDESMTALELAFGTIEGLSSAEKSEVPAPSVIEGLSPEAASQGAPGEPAASADSAVPVDSREAAIEGGSRQGSGRDRMANGRFSGGRETPSLEPGDENQNGSEMRSPRVVID